MVFIGQGGEGKAGSGVRGRVLNRQEWQGVEATTSKMLAKFLVIIESAFAKIAFALLS